MNTLLSAITCTKCGGSLKEKKLRKGVVATCQKCSATFPFDDGVLIMLSKKSLKDQHNVHQQTYYDKEYNKSYANKQFEWRNRYIQRLIKFLPKQKDSLVLDLACGQGYMTLAVAKLGYNVVACDISLGGLYRAKHEAERLGISENILFLAGDINTLRFKKNVFQFLILLHVLEHMSNDHNVIKRLMAFSTNKARFYIGVPLSFQYVFPLVIPLYKSSDKRVGHIRRYTAETLLALFDGKGKPISTIYTGHLLKIFGALLSFLKINTFAPIIENHDEKLLRVPNWASNLTMVVGIKR